MTHRCPFQPLTFCDSVRSKEIIKVPTINIYNKTKKPKTNQKLPKQQMPLANSAILQQLSSNKGTVW